ncbi:MAG: hypothetical protein K2K04_04950, partial [Clostridia bacterium]|nr:hypothetical protein [Clostridia bacterium]
MWDISSKSEKANGKKRSLPLKLKTINSTNVILWRYFTFFALGVIAVIALVCYGILGSAVTSQARRRVRSVGRDMTVIINGESVTTDEIVQKITDYSLSDGVDVFIFDADGKLEMPYITLSEEKIAPIYNALNSNLGEWKEGKVAEYSSRHSNRTTFNFAECITLNGGQYRLLVRYPISHIAELVKKMEIYLLIVGLGAFVIAFLISYSLANKLSGPIREISGTAQKLAGGNYDVQFNSAQYAEIAKLSDTLNYMKDEIKKSDDFRKELLANVSHD